MGASLPGAATAFDSDPAPVVEAAFRRVLAENAGDVPLTNAALSCEALPFHLTADGWLGVLVTPWYLNLMLLPAPGVAWSPRSLGEKDVVRLPGGDFEFFWGEVEGVGSYRYCSLISPMAQFQTQGAAMEVARQALALIFDAGTREQLRQSAPDAPQPETKPVARSPEAPMARREFLRGLIPSRKS